MLVNPIIIIVTCAIILFSLIYAVVNRPAKPMLTGVFILLFIVYLGICSLINLALDPVQDGIIPHKISLAICGFLTAQGAVNSAHLEYSFDVFRNIDVALFIASIISMIIELRSIFVKLKAPIEKEFDQTQIKKEEDRAKKAKKDEKKKNKKNEARIKKEAKLAKTEKGV